LILISHRGNLNGVIEERENDPKYINKAIEKGYNVEVDVRFENSKFFLGHDFSQYHVDNEFCLIARYGATQKQRKLWRLWKR